MKTTQLLVIFVLSTFLSCKEKVNKRSTFVNAVGISKRPSEVLLDSNQNFLYFDTSSYIVKINPKFDSLKLITYENKTIWISNEELFLFYKHAEQFVLKDGQNGQIQSNKILLQEDSIIKFEYQSDLLNVKRCEDLNRIANENNIELEQIFNSISKKDCNAFKQLIKLKDFVDGGAAEDYYLFYFIYLNLWSDEELEMLITKLTKDEIELFCDISLDASHINPKKYYKKFYPRTLNKIKERINYNGVR